MSRCAPRIRLAPVPWSRPVVALLATGSLAVVALLPPLARAHFSYRDATLQALSADGSLGLFVVVEGDTEGGAEGETLLIAHIGDGITPTGLTALLPAESAVVVAVEEVLPYVPSPGAMVSHDERDRAAAPGRRERFHAGPVAEHGVTVAAAERAFPRRKDGRFGRGADAIAVRERDDRRAELRRGDAVATVAEPWGEGRACVEAIYRTDDPAVVVVQIFAWEGGGACPADRRAEFGPPPTRTFFLVTLAR